jgi:alkylated DNA nucleotide flippase Atl1
MAKKKSWREKLDGNPDLPKIQELTSDTDPPRLTGWMVIPSAWEIYEIMKKIPAGKLITVQEIRAILARRHGANLACPLTTGMFVRIAAQAAEEAAAEGAQETAPYWRTLKSGGILNDKYPGGVEAQKQRLEEEGHKVVHQGKNYCVLEYDESLLDEDFFSI